MILRAAQVPNPKTVTTEPQPQPAPLPIQLVSTDFDGTIFAEFENPPVAESLQSLLAELQAQGVRWVINTGRDLSSLLEAVARAHLSVRPDYLVLVEREIYCHEGTRYAPLEDWNRRCTEDHTRLFRRVRRDLPRLRAWILDHFTADLYEDAWSPLSFIAKTNADADAIEAFLLDYCRAVPDLTLVRNDVYARFSHRAYSKGSALSEIARRLGLAAEKVFAAGDHLNDLPMLSRERAAFLAAPANAIPQVRETVLRQGGFVSDQPYGSAVESALRYYLSSAPPAPTHCP